MPGNTVPTGSGRLARRLLAEAVATCGLLLVIFALARTRRLAAAPAAVGAYIGAIRTLYPNIQPADAAAVLVPHPS